MGMRDTSSGAEVSWDWQLGTFTGVVPGHVYRAATIEELETLLGATLSPEARAYLIDMKQGNPFVAPKRTVTKLQFMALFRPDDLDKIYLAALGGEPYPPLLTVRVRQALDRVDRAEGNMVDLMAPETAGGLTAMEGAGLITAGDAERIKKGLPWV
jgi:hypothetical protein